MTIEAARTKQAAPSDTGSRTLRVFVSAPSDVRPERLMTGRLVQRLASEFSAHFRLEPVLWEREPLVAAHHFQTSITRPSETDIVVVLLWSRLGFPLPIEEFPGPISGAQVTGTEWEFENALAAYRTHGLPDLLLYRKTASVIASLDDPAALNQQLQQKQLVESFIQRWFIDPEAKTFTAAFREFRSADELETMLEEHLRELLERRLSSQDKSAGVRQIAWHDGSPYRGLESFELKHSPIFFGRTRERHDLRELLARRAQAGCAFVLVFGASGSGKSSVVRAGLLADLQLPGMIDNIALCRYCVFRPSVTPDDLLLGLASAMLADTALPELLTLHYDAAALSAALREAPQLLRAPLRTALATAGVNAKLAEGADARLVLIVDQLEELFTTDRCSETARNGFVTALDALARSGHVWIVATMRSDFFQRVPELPKLAELSAGEGRYLLGPPDPAAIDQIVRRPAKEAGLQFEYDRKRDMSLADAIERDAAQAPDALPLLEFALDQLWGQRSERAELTFAAYESFGGLLGSIGQRAEQEFAQLPVRVQTALPRVLLALATSGANAKLVAQPAELGRFSISSPERALIDALLAPRARLLVAHAELGTVRVRVAHEALLTHWRRASEQLASDLADLQTRTRLEEAAALWSKSTSSERASLLLNPGLPLATAEDLVRRIPDSLDPDVVAFVAASTKAAQASARRARIRLQVLAGVFATLALFAFWSAQRARTAAKQEREAATRADAAATLARSRELVAVAEGLKQTDPEAAVLVAQAALDVDANPRAEAVLRSALQHTSRLVLKHPRVKRVHFSPDGSQLVSAGLDGAARIWNVATGALIRSLREANPSPLHDAVFAAGTETVATAAEDGKVRVWNAGTGELERLLKSHGRSATALAVTNDGATLAAGDTDSVVTLWDLASGKLIRTIRTQSDRSRSSGVHEVQFSADARRILVAGDDSSASIWSVADGAPVDRLDLGTPVLGAAFDAESGDVVTTSNDKAHLWPTGTRQTAWSADYGSPVGAIAIDATGERMAVAGASGVVTVWRKRSALPEQRLFGHQGFIRSVAMGRYGAIASAGDDQTIRLWDTLGRTPLSTLAGHNGEVASVSRRRAGDRDCER